MRQGVLAETYSYMSVNGSFNWHGNVSEAEIQGQDAVIKITTDPSEPSAIFPFTYNSTIGYTSTRTVVAEIAGFPVYTTVISVERNVIVDAYGEMKLPGGHVVEALRIKEDETTTVEGPVPITTRSITYIFVAKDGSQLSVPSDTTQPTSGVINNSASISWNTNLITSGLYIGRLTAGKFTRSINMNFMR